MQLLEWYKDNFEDQLLGRYITLEKIIPVLKKYQEIFKISVVGNSELSKEILMVEIGAGEKKVLAWSQMHGNESTTTKAVFDFFKLLTNKEIFQNEINQFLHDYTFYVIPILNPDGAEAYTRENSNQVDINRDAQALSQKESQVLRAVFDTVKPDLCFNLHDQRTIYGATYHKAATVSFLSPAADESRSLTPSRICAMEYISKMNYELQKLIPGHIGRYDDSFNINCVGDTFQHLKVPTILFEAGHSPKDYKREKTREYIFYALCSAFDMISNRQNFNSDSYFEIPNNTKNFRDVMLRNVTIDVKNAIIGSISIQFKEVLRNDTVVFVPMIDAIGDLDLLIGHEEIDVKNASLLINSQKKYHVGQEILNIIENNSNSTVYFSV